jgi:tryptophan synthase alpha chain
MNRFQRLFQDPKMKAVIPFFMLGDPTPEASLEIIKTAIDTGCHALELGIPFSDPIADGPIIQAAAKRALDAGTTFKQSLLLLEAIRRYSDLPIGLLLYYNLVFRQGISQAHQHLANSGIDAILIADLPLGYSAEHETSLQQQKLGAIQLIAPNTPLARARQLLEHSTAFTYVVSVHGTTGVREKVSVATIERVQALRALSKQPLVVGFGISQKEHVTAIHEAGANGAIIGSAFIQMIAQHEGNLSAMKTAISTHLTHCLGE